MARRERHSLATSLIVAILTFPIALFLLESFTIVAMDVTLSAFDGSPSRGLAVIGGILGVAFVTVICVATPLAAYLAARYVYLHLRWEQVEPGGRWCVDCGYDLTGNVTGRCPECGTGTGIHAFEPERSHEPGCGKTRAIMRTPGDRLLLTTWILLAVSGSVGAAAFLVAGGEKGGQANLLRK